MLQLYGAAQTSLYSNLHDLKVMSLETMFQTWPEMEKILITYEFLIMEAEVVSEVL
jgi:hypothetical protein